MALLNKLKGEPTGLSSLDGQAKAVCLLCLQKDVCSTGLM